MSALRDFLLAFADDEHLMGQQHTEWIGVAPFLEEDLAFASIAQDELGHAAQLYELVLDLDGQPVDDPTIDALAFDRSAADYRSAAFAEVPTPEWAEALVRHWIHDAAEQLRWANVAQSTHTPLAELATHVEREEIFHRLHADSLLDALLPVDEAGARLRQALDQLAPLIPTLLASTDAEADLVEAGLIARRTEELLGDLTDRIEDRFGTRLDLSTAPAGRPQRSDHFAPLMARMREVLDYDPAATW